MKRRISTAIPLCLVFSAGCGSDDGTPPQDTSSSGPTSTASTTTLGSSGPPTSTTTVASTGGTTSTSNTVTSTTEPSTTSPPPSCDPETTGNATTGTMGFEFRNTSYCDYMQIDRVGFPLVTTLMVSSSSVADYNAAPTSENINAWVTEINSTFFDLHPELDAEIQSNGLTPSDFQVYSEQLTPLVVPDTLKLDPTAPDGFPNGRRLEEPTLDLVLALLLLDLSVDPIDALANLPLGPGANDVALPGTWPHVAGPQ